MICNWRKPCCRPPLRRGLPRHLPRRRGRCLTGSSNHHALGDTTSRELPTISESAVTNRTGRRKAPRVTATRGYPALQPEGNRMSQKNRRSNKEAKKPKQNKAKVVVSSSPFAAALHTNPA